MNDKIKISTTQQRKKPITKNLKNNFPVDKNKKQNKGVSIQQTNTLKEQHTLDPINQWTNVPRNQGTN